MIAIPALRLVEPPAPATPAAHKPLSAVLAEYRAKADQLLRAKAKMAVIENEHQAAARAVYVAAGKGVRRPLIVGDSVVYVDGTEAAPVVKIVQGEVVA